MADELRGQQRQRGIVVQVEPAAGLRQHAAMAMVGVLAEAFIRHEQDAILKPCLRSRSQRLLHNAVVFQGARTRGVLVRGDAEEDERLDAEIDGGADFVDELVHAELVVAGHRRDFFFEAASAAHEQRQY